jgi:hypothetical protein
MLLQELDWQCVRCIASTGEASSPEDSLWLMSQAGYKPVIEASPWKTARSKLSVGCISRQSFTQEHDTELILAQSIMHIYPDQACVGMWGHGIGRCLLVRIFAATTSAVRLQHSLLR